MKKEESDAGDCYEEAANMFRKTNTSGQYKKFITKYSNGFLKMPQGLSKKQLNNIILAVKSLK